MILCNAAAVHLPRHQCHSLDIKCLAYLIHLVCVCCLSVMLTRMCIPFSETDIKVVDLAFQSIKDSVLLTANKDLTFNINGNVQLTNVPNIPTPVISIMGPNSFIQMNTGIPPCISNIDLCTTGFTFALDVSFTNLLDNTYILSSGGQLPGVKGVALYYNNNMLTYIVSSSTFTWKLDVHYTPVLQQWQHFEITWNKHLGIELLLNGHPLGSNGRPTPSTSTQTTFLCVGCSHSTNSVTINFMVGGIMSWAIDRTELVNAGIKDGEFMNRFPMLQCCMLQCTLISPLLNCIHISHVLTV